MKPTVRYNRSEIMTSAWYLYNLYGKATGLTFGDCLKDAWKDAKNTIARNEAVKAELDAMVKREAERAANWNKVSEADAYMRNAYTKNVSLYGVNYANNIAQTWV